MIVNCVIVADGSATSIKIEEWKTVSLLKESIRNRKWRTLMCEPDQLQLFLTKQGDQWLTVKEVKDGGSDTSSLTPLLCATAPLNRVGLSKEAVCVEVSGDDVLAGKIPVHVLVVVPEHARERPAISFSPRPAEPLVSSVGSQWDFQKPSELDSVATAIPMHFAAWKRGAHDKMCHPLFLCLDGPGTGKLRLLTEFPRLVNDALKDHNNKEMLSLLQNAFTFNVSLENGTKLPFFADPSLEIGTRMLYQLQDSLPWDTFCLDPAHHVPPSVVLSRLPQLTGVHPREMCVVLCVDGLQKLEHETGSKSSSFNHALGTLCGIVNGSDWWVIAVA